MHARQTGDMQVLTRHRGLGRFVARRTVFRLARGHLVPRAARAGMPDECFLVLVECPAFAESRMPITRNGQQRGVTGDRLLEQLAGDHQRSVTVGACARRAPHRRAARRSDRNHPSRVARCHDGKSYEGPGRARCRLRQQPDALIAGIRLGGERSRMQRYAQNEQGRKKFHRTGQVTAGHHSDADVIACAELSPPMGSSQGFRWAQPARCVPSRARVPMVWVPSLVWLPI